MFDCRNIYSFFFNDPATTEIYTLSLHDALPIYRRADRHRDVDEAGHKRTAVVTCGASIVVRSVPIRSIDRKSTRLNSSHGYISYAVFCLKKKKKETS